MGEGPCREMQIIDLLLGEEGVIRYNAVKSRFGGSDSKSLLHLYTNFTSSVEEGAIFSYHKRLERLRKKIEDARRRAAVARPYEASASLISSATMRDSISISISEEEVLAEEAQDGKQGAGPAAGQPSSSAICPQPASQASQVGAQRADSSGREARKAEEAVQVSQLTNLESLKFANIVGSVKVMDNEKKIPAVLKLENGRLIEMWAARDRAQGSGRRQEAREKKAEYDVAPSKLFLVCRKKSLFSLCFSKKTTVSFVSLGKEISVVNFLKNNRGYEIILKNTQTSKFARIKLQTLELCIQDGNYKNHFYLMECHESFVRWILALKFRIDAVDLWNGSELWNSLNYPAGQK